MCRGYRTAAFADNQFDFCFSNLAVQWCDSLAAALAGLVRVTRPGGVVAFSTLLSGSLDELNQAFSGWTATVTPTVFSAVRRFPPPVSLTGILCQKCVTGSPLILCPRCCTPQGDWSYPCSSGTCCGLMTRNKLIQLANHYPAEDGVFPLSYLIQYGVIHVEK